MTSASFYSSVPDAPREDHLAAYLKFLAARDGTVDAASTYPQRDAWLRASEGWTARHRAEIDPTEFERHYARFDPSAEPEAAMSALLAFVKMNAGEAYGVEVVSRRRHGRAPTGELVDTVERLIGKEETYHTRILLGATRQFGLEAPTAAWNPPPGIKAVIGAIAYSPRALFHPILLGTEIGGLFAFHWMLQRVGEIFRDEPELKESLEQRLLEILVDEVGHIAFNRIAVGPAGLSTARALAPRVAAATSGHLGEFRALGWTKGTLDAFDRFDLHSLPEQVRRQSFFV